ncbi:hypothetical protein KP78_12050 [Jeotgalibacillus soli]|uniref:Uncharacterized protein n=1 Tax=Jeotgalibacillus soli TaxID=889306 RepID=A0A0C2VLE6_9BACL|nr:hypothetical protein KP78_12050 [Jeotgalibacillus soli]
MRTTWTTTRTTLNNSFFDKNLLDIYSNDGSILSGLLEKGTIADIRAPLRF